MLSFIKALQFLLCVGGWVRGAVQYNDDWEMNKLTFLKSLMYHI